MNESNDPTLQPLASPINPATGSTEPSATPRPIVVALFEGGSYVMGVGLLINSLIMILQLLVLVMKGQDPGYSDLAYFATAFAGVLMMGLYFAGHMMAVSSFRRPWVWTYDLILIVLGILGGPTLLWARKYIPSLHYVIMLFSLSFFGSIPLVIDWLKPETKAYFGRS